MDNLRVLREAAGLSQQKLANQVHLIQQQVYQYENGIYEPDIGTLKAFADFFNTSIDFLVGRTDIRRRIEVVEEYDLNEEEKGLIDRFRRLLPNYRRSVMMFLDALDGD